MRDRSIVSGGLEDALITPFSVRTLRISTVDMAATCLRMDLRALRVFFRERTEIPMRRSVNRRFLATGFAGASGLVDGGRGMVGFAGFVGAAGVGAGGGAGTLGVA